MPVPQIRTYKKGPRGEALLKKLSKKIVVTLAKTGEVFEFPKDDEDVRCLIPKGGQVFVTLSSDKNTLMGVRPLKGAFYVKIKSFAASKDKEPTPRHYEGIGRKKDGETYPYSYEGFTVILEIVKGDWKKSTIPSFLRYKFVDAGDGESAGISGTGKHTEILFNFLELAGIDMVIDTIPLSENVLPWLEQTLLARNSVFQAIVAEGYITAFAPSPGL